MSNIYTHTNERIAEYLLIFHAILQKNNAAEVIRSKQVIIAQLHPMDIVELVDRLLQENTAMDDIKMGIVKFLALAHKPIVNYPYSAPAEGSFLDYLLQNNVAMENHLYAIRCLLKGFQANSYDEYSRKELRIIFKDLEEYVRIYDIKEQVLFPLLQQTWPNAGCLQVMSSFQHDARKNLADIQLILAFPDVDLPLFNKILGRIFLNMLGVKLRDEHILFPSIQASIPNELLDGLFEKSIEIGFPYMQPKPKN